MSRHETPINKQRKVVAESEGENTESKTWGAQMGVKDEGRKTGVCAILGNKQQTSRYSCHTSGLRLCCSAQLTFCMLFGCLVVFFFSPCILFLPCGLFHKISVQQLLHPQYNRVQSKQIFLVTPPSHNFTRESPKKTL